MHLPALSFYRQFKKTSDSSLLSVHRLNLSKLKITYFGKTGERGILGQSYGESIYIRLDVEVHG